MAVHRCLLIASLLFPTMLAAQRTQKPALHGRHWVAITGKPLGAEAGAMIFQKGGNAVDAACAMLAAVTTMWDVLSWGGETQALIYNPKTKKVIAVNALGVAPTGATADFYRSKGMRFPLQGGTNPYLPLLQRWSPRPVTTSEGGGDAAALAAFDEAFRRGTTSIEAADTSGWVVSVTPSGGWIPAVIAGHTGIGVSQRAQQF